MNKKFQISILVLSLLAFFGVSNFAYASGVFASQLLNSDSQNFLNDATHTYVQGIGFAVSATIEQVDFYFKQDSGGVRNLTVRGCDNDDYTSTGTCTNMVSYSSNEQTTANSTKTLYEFTFTDAYFENQYLYILILSCGGVSNCTLYGSNSDVFADGEFAILASGTETLADLYFNVYTTQEIGFNTLTDGGTYSDFENWDLSLGSPPINAVVEVLYLQNGTTYGFRDRATWYPPYSQTSFQVPKSTPLWKVPYNFDTQWSARAYLYDTDGETVIASTNEITFTINGAVATTYTPSSTTPYATVSSTTEFSYQNIDCTIDTGWTGVPTAKGWECILRKSGSWLFQLIFVPSTVSTNFLSSAYSEFKTVFPFSIFFSITDTLTSAIGDEDLVASQDITYTWESPRLISPSGSVLTASSSDNITFSSDTTLSSIIGASLQNTLFNGLLLLFIIASVYGIYKLFVHH